ncbi:MAG: hypothetical protein LAT65_15935 [Saccharospirillum sp.]|nr:hypothetical protein [Saccharospirillum sp.]
MRTSAFEESELCPAGGILIELGTDANKDGTLQDDEVEQSQEICNGTNGTAGVDGQDGTDGQDGSDGSDGSDGRNSIIEVTAVLPGHETCEFGGTQIDVGLDDGHGEIDETTLPSTFVCRETPECTWQDNGDGTLLVTCAGGSEYVVVSSSALDFEESISCSVVIPKPGTDGTETSLILYTIDKIGSSLKYVRLTILDGANEYSTSRMLASNSPDYELAAIRAFYDVLGDPNGGRFTALLNEDLNRVAFLYTDLDVGEDDEVEETVPFAADAFTEPEEESRCRRFNYD